MGVVGVSLQEEVPREAGEELGHGVVVFTGEGGAAGGREQEGAARASGSCPSQSPLSTLQLEERAARSAEYGNSLQSSRSEIADLNVCIQKLRSQILSVKSHVRA